MTGKSPTETVLSDGVAEKSVPVIVMVLEDTDTPVIVGVESDRYSK